VAIADLIYTIAGDSSRFVRALQAADRQLERTTGNMSRIGKIGATLGAGLALAGTGVMELTRRAAQDMAEIQKIADSSGVSTEQLSKLGYVASTVGLQLDDLRDAAFEVALKMGEAARGEGPAIDAFANIGVAVMDANGAMRESGDVMDEAINKLAGIEHPATRAAAAAALLGDDVSLKMAPMLSRGSDEIKRMGDEAKELGLVFDQEAGKAALEFQGNLIRLEGAAQGLGRHIATQLGPALNILTGEMVENAKKTQDMREKQMAAVDVMKTMLISIRALGFGMKAVSLFFAQFAAGLTVSATATIKQLQEVGNTLAVIANPVNLTTESGKAQLTAIAGRIAANEAERDAVLIQMQKDRQESWSSFLEDVDRINKAQVTPGATGVAELDRLRKEANGIIEATKTSRERFAEEMAKLQDVFDAGLIPRDLFNKRKKQLEDQYKNAGKSAGKSFVDGAAEKAKEMAGVAERVMKDMQDAANRIFSETRTDAERAVAKLEEIRFLRAAGMIDEDTEQRATTSVETERDSEYLAFVAETEARAQAIRESVFTDVQRLQQGIRELDGFLASALIDENVYAMAVQKLNEELDPATKRLREMTEAGKALAEQMRTPGEELTLELERINELLAAGAIDAETYDRALNKLFAKKKPKAELTAFQELGANAARELQSGLGNFLADPFAAAKAVTEKARAEFDAELQKLKSSLDQGLISKETFAKRKAEIERELKGVGSGFGAAIAQGVSESLKRLLSEMLAKQAIFGLLKMFGASPEFMSAAGFRVEGFAEGGYVAGPGTATSDSIPARLSNGEYVMPAATVRHFGRDFMDGIRAMRPQREAPVARFAEGGYVQGGQGTGAGVRVVNVVDSSMVQDFLTSSAGEQIVMNVIRRNRRQVSQVMA
jgi:hypothetical protein